MKINNIDPFLRFVNRIHFEPIQQNCHAADCHFFYMDEDCCPVMIDGTRYDPGLGSVVIVPAGTDYYFLRDGILCLVSVNFDYTRVSEHIDKERAPVLKEFFSKADITERPNFEDHTYLNRICRRLIFLEKQVYFVDIVSRGLVRLAVDGNAVPHLILDYEHTDLF